MKIESIRYFLALCKERHFTRAAEACGISQPSMTLFILRLEKQFGGPLFKRSRNSYSEPTEFALALKPHLERALSAFEDADRIARKHRGEDAPRISDKIRQPKRATEFAEG